MHHSSARNYSLPHLILWLAATHVLLCSAAPAPTKTVVDELKRNAQTRPRLEENARRQITAARDLKAFHDFKFVDRYEQSQIRFEHTVVEEAAKNWVPGHYDHGTGMAVGDVDGDGLQDIYFVNQIGGNQLWRNTGRGRFENITATAGVSVADKVCVTASFADIDNDGDQDLFVTTVKMGNVLFRNLGQGRFQDATAEAGLGYVGHSSGAVFFDFNRDGLLDLFVANVGIYTTDKKGPGGFYLTQDDAFKSHLKPERSEQSLLYQNLGGGKFKDVSREMNLEHRGWSGDATACDVNSDGYPDLYVVSMQGDDKFYENQQGKGFVEKTAAYFPKTPWGAMCAKFFDYNLDGLMDLFVADMHSDMTERQSEQGKKDFQLSFEKVKSEPWCAVEWTDAFLQGGTNNLFGNAFYQKQRDGSFREVSDRLGVETYWPWGHSVADLNADGYEDIFITAGMGYPFRYGINSVLLNVNGERFADVEYVLGVEPREGGRIEKEYFTLDASGADKDRIESYHKKGTVAVVGSVSSRSSVILDIDGDGDLDIVTNEMNDRPQILISNLSEKRNLKYLQVALVGSRSNKDALGSTVNVTAGGKTYTRYHDGKSGYLAHSSSLPLYFGLGDATKIDRIDVTWPSGKKQTLTANLQANRLLKIEEPRE